MFNPSPIAHKKFWGPLLMGRDSSWWGWSAGPTSATQIKGTLFQKGSPLGPVWHGLNQMNIMRITRYLVKWWGWDHNGARDDITGAKHRHNGAIYASTLALASPKLSVTTIHKRVCKIAYILSIATTTNKRRHSRLTLSQESEPTNIGILDMLQAGSKCRSLDSTQA